MDIKPKNDKYILVAEDSLTQAENLRLLLLQNNYEVEVAVNGKEAYEKIKLRRPTLVISDIMMPEMDGFQFCKKVKEHEEYRNIPFMLLTSLSDPEDIMKGLDSGADNFVLKPYDEEYLLIRIHNLIINCQLRKSEKFQMGMEVYFNNRYYMINSDRRQILDLLMSTFDNALQQNRELNDKQSELSKLNEELGHKTAELMAANELLKKQIIEKEKMENQTSQLNIQLKNYISQLETLNTELESFSYSVSHDLRSPIRSINAFSRLLIDEYSEKLDKEGIYYVETIRKSTYKMSELIEDLMKLSKIDNSEMKIEDVNLSEIVSTALFDLQKNDQDRRVKLFISDDILVKGDKNFLKIAMTNLLGNAWKYTMTNPEACIEFGSDNKDGKNIYFVKDNGIGFNMAHADKLFIAFRRLHKDDNFPGTGIGLAIVDRIIKSHKGEIWAESEENKGSTFFFTLSPE